MKKFLAILSIMLVVIVMSCAFAASKFPDTVGTKYDAAVEKLTNSKIIDGFDDGTFKPLNNVTRAQLCKLIVESLKLQNVTNVVLTKFPDVNQQQWFYPYVKTAVDNGVIVGYPDGNFNPNNNVTFAESFTMILRAMGREKTMTDKTWPTAYVNEAKVQGLLNNVTYTDVNLPASRGEVAITLYNMVLKKEAEKATEEAEKKVAEERAKKEAAEKTPKNFDIVDTTSEGSDDDYYVKLKGIKTKKEVISLEGSKSYKYSKLEEYEDRVIGYNDTKNDDEIEIKMSYKAKDLDSAKVITKVEGSVATFGDKNTFDVTKNKDVYKYYTFIKVNCDVDEDDGEITFTKVTIEGTGLDSVSLAKADRIIMDSSNYVFAIFKGIDVDATIKNGKASESSSADTDDYLFGIVEDITTKSSTKYVDFEDDKKTYEVSSKSSNFQIDALACYTKDGSIIKLVRNIPATLLDNGSGVDIVESASGKKGDQIVEFKGSTSKIDTSNPKTYINYSVCTVEVDEDKNGYLYLSNADDQDSLEDVKFEEGDRVLIDKSNQIFVVFQGLDYSASYSGGSRKTTTKQYTVSYSWSTSKPSGVSPTPTSKEVDANDYYTIPNFKCSGYTITCRVDGGNINLGQSFKVTGDKTIYISAEKNDTPTPTPTTYTVSYAWEDGYEAISDAKIAGKKVTEYKDTVEAGTVYETKLPVKDGITFHISEGEHVTINKNTTLKVWYDRYEITYKWALNKSLSGVKPEPKTTYVAPGSSFSVPDFKLEGYIISADPDTISSVDSDTEIELSYKEEEYEIKYEWADEDNSIGGTDYRLPDPVTVKYGDKYTPEVEQIPGVELICNPSKEFTVTGNKTIEVTVKEI